MDTAQRKIAVRGEAPKCGVPGSAAGGFVGLREKLDKHPQATIAFAVAVLVAACAFGFFQLLPGHRIPGVSSKAYFTTEDNLTGQAALDALFVASVSNVPPFDHNGKPAYRAVVYNCNGGRTRWIQNLRRFTPAVRDQVVAAYVAEEAKGIHTDAYLAPFEDRGLEVKAPGAGSWVRVKDHSYANIVTPTPPPGVPSDDLMDDVP